MNPRQFPSEATRRLTLAQPPRLDAGTTLPRVDVAYRTWGRLDPHGANAVVVCHALTGSADVDRWWEPLLGPGRALDPDRDFIVASNVLGGCYGTTGPGDPVPGTDRAWGPEFPQVTVRDMVRVQKALLDELGVRHVRLVIGGSLGGMQVLEWGLLYPEFVGTLVPIATCGRHSAWAIGLSAAQRAALRADPRWRDGRYPAHDPPAAGLAAARAIAMCSYRSPASLGDRFGRRADGDGFAVESWIGQHGTRLVERFDANSYDLLTRAMDAHDVGRDRGGYAEALARLDRPALVVSIPSDVLYPPAEQDELARLLPRGRLARLPSPHGHDGFLIEAAALSALVKRFRTREAARPRAARTAVPLAAD